MLRYAPSGPNDVHDMFDNTIWKWQESESLMRSQTSKANIWSIANAKPLFLILCPSSGLKLLQPHTIHEYDVTSFSLQRILVDHQSCPATLESAQSTSPVMNVCFCGDSDSVFLSLRCDWTCSNTLERA